MSSRSKVAIPEMHLENLLLYSFRYCLGRMSYAVSDCVEYLEKYWGVLSPHMQRLIQTEIVQAIEEECAGMPCDVEQWNKILKLEVK